MQAPTLGPGTMACPKEPKADVNNCKADVNNCTADEPKVLEGGTIRAVYMWEPLAGFLFTIDVSLTNLVATLRVHNLFDVRMTASLPFAREEAEDAT